MIAAQLLQAAPDGAAVSSAVSSGEADPVICVARAAIERWETSENMQRESLDPSEQLVLAWKRANPEPKGEAEIAAWSKQWRQISVDSGYEAATRERGHLAAAFATARAQLVLMRPVTVEGLLAKAKAALVTYDEELEEQLANDICVLFGQREKDADLRASGPALRN